MTVKEFLDDWDWSSAIDVSVGNGYVWSNESRCSSAQDFRDNIEEVVAASAGENDGAEWIAILRMKDGRCCLLRAGCDYTGWCCQAGGSVEDNTLEFFLGPLGLTGSDRERLEDELKEKGYEYHG